MGTGEGVYRDMFYNGDIKLEPGAVVCRVAPSFIRFGTFQLPVSRGGIELDLVKQVADYVIKYHYPHLQGRVRHKVQVGNTLFLPVQLKRCLNVRPAILCQDAQM